MPNLVEDSQRHPQCSSIPEPFREPQPKEDSNPPPLPWAGHSPPCSQLVSSLALLRRGPLCIAEWPRGALCESFPVILLGEVLPFFKARFDIFTGLTSGAFWSRKKAGILSFVFTKPLIGFFIKLDSIISSIRVGAQLYLVQDIKQF